MCGLDNIWVVFDIDGVITDGTIITDGISGVNKRVNLKDIDAIYELVRRGVKIAALTAEKDQFSVWVKNRFPWDEFFDGVVDKGSMLSMLKKKYSISSGNLYYIGDGKKDINAFAVADVSICPADAISDVRNVADIILSGTAGSGVLWELVQLVLKGNHSSNEIPSFPISDSANVGNVWSETLKRHKLVLELMEQEEVSNTICESAAMISRAIREGHKLILFGNGGSAADAQHIAAEFVGKFNTDRASLNAIALTTNSSVLTAIANDINFDHIFSRQVNAIVSPDDVVVGISTSGRSRNILEGLNAARHAKAHTIMLTGATCRDNLADICICVPSTYTPCIQEMHIIVGHFWADFTERDIYESNSCSSSTIYPI